MSDPTLNDVSKTLEDILKTLEDISKTIKISEYHVWPIGVNVKQDLEAHLKRFQAGGWIILNLIPDPGGGPNDYWAITYRNAKF
jgi:hypothetical protein